VLFHGFTRQGTHLAPLATALATVGIGSIRPDLGSFNWFRSVNNATYLDRVAQRISATLTGPAVLIGHSAGGAAAAHVASRLDDVAGIVFVDANESPTHLIERAWPDISHLPTFAICAPPSRCNRDGAFARWAQLHGVDGCVVDGMGHGDIEGARHGIYRIVCGDASSAETRALVQALVVASTQRFLDLPETSDPWGSPEVHPW
jgi:pimeloyl-ACP methyl ester carboxylesterase